MANHGFPPPVGPDAICLAPPDDDDGEPDADGNYRVCGDPATKNVLVEDLVTPLCERHAKMLEEEESTYK